MAWTDQSEGRYKFPPLWFGGTEVSCRGQFRIAAMSVTAVLEGHVLNSRPVTLLYTYLPCSPLPFSFLPFFPFPPPPSFSLPFPLSLSASRCPFSHFNCPFSRAPHLSLSLPSFPPSVSPLSLTQFLPSRFLRLIRSRREAPPWPQPTSQIIVHVMGHAHRIEPTGNNKVEGGLSKPIYGD